MAVPVVAALSSIACGPPPQVRSFSVLPLQVCPGHPATVQWDVEGRAALLAKPPVAGWTDGEVASAGSRTVTPTTTTAFTVTALDANLADGHSSGTRSVDVLRASEERAASTTCDAAARKCTGSFVLDDGTGTIRVRTLSAPKVVRSGVVKQAAVTVTHGDWKAVVADGAPTTVDQPASGTWTLEVDLSAEDAPAPPPQLRVHVDFGCP